LTSPLARPASRRELGLLDAVVVVAGGIIGVGIFANPSNVARVLGDPVLILIAWALGGIVALLGSVVWAELASRFPEVGGQYVYLQRACHPVVGFLYGIALLFIINGGSLAAVSMLFASYVDRSVVPLGGGGRGVAAATLAGLTAVNAIGVRAGKWTNIFGLTACALLIVRRRDPSPPGEIARAPGHPVTTLAFVLVAAGVVINTFVVYPAQSLTGTAILLAATVLFFAIPSVRRDQP
jgi:APA family basic amino acid/polyamine antiporter